MSVLRLFVPRAAVMLALAGFVAASTGTAHAYQCKSYPTQSIAFAKSKYVAKVKATKGWSTNVKQQFGMVWSVYKIAKAKQILCTPYQVKHRIYF